MSNYPYRAKVEGVNRWYEGYYWSTNDTSYCFLEDYERHPENTKHYLLFDEMTDWGLPNRKLQARIVLETLCKYSGVLDTNKINICEKDVVRIHDSEKYFKGTIFEDCNTFCVVYCDGAFVLSDDLNIRKVRDTMFLISKFAKCDIEVVGNIKDNKGLLKRDIK